MLNSKHRLVIAAFASLFGVIGCIGCSSSTPEAEPRANTHASLGDCSPHPRNPDCDEDTFLLRAWELANEDPWENGAVQVTNASGCLAMLAGAGAIILGTAEIPPVAVAVGSVVGALGGIGACRGLVSYLDKSGVLANASCFTQPWLPDRDIDRCECRESCVAGYFNSGQLGDFSSPRPFAFGYLAAGSSNCFCTDDPKEEACRRPCSGTWVSADDPSDCACEGGGE